MNQKALNALEYPKIIEKLTEKASSYMGKQLCKNLEPSTDLETIRLMQVQTKDALTRLFQKGSISFGNVKDIRGSLKRLEIGSALSIQEILAVCGLLENTSRVKTYSRKERNDLPGDSLDSMFDGLSPLTPLSTEIRRCILSEEEISDGASPALRQIRRNMKITNDRIHTQLAGLVNGSARTYLQDSVITMRNGRYCIPVKAEYKGQVPGMIHDQSSTGSTLFIEPMSVVKLNNDMRELELQEQKEIEVILADLSQQIATEQEAISLNLELMVQLDFIFARATLAMEMNASEPVFNDEGRINLKKARHPLINKKKVVPIDIRLGDEFDLLVITGPNTGGKTVSLPGDKKPHAAGAACGAVRIARSLQEAGRLFLAGAALRRGGHLSRENLLRNAGLLVYGDVPLTREAGQRHASVRREEGVVFAGPRLVVAVDTREFVVAVRVFTAVVHVSRGDEALVQVEGSLLGERDVDIGRGRGAGPRYHVPLSDERLLARVLASVIVRLAATAQGYERRKQHTENLDVFHAESLFL